MSKQRWGLQKGFTIVELLIVIVVIAILAAIVIVAYNGVQARTRLAKLQNDMQALQGFIETYYTQHGEYPKTTNNTKANWKAIDVETDANCANGTSVSDWIPGIGETLPQSDPTASTGADGKKGCFLYVSDGSEYVISAWNMLSQPQTDHMYRRVGFRQFQSDSSTQFYTCNDNVVGGANGGYDITKDYYKYSLTISNITDCNETPPSGA